VKEGTCGAANCAFGGTSGAGDGAFGAPVADEADGEVLAELADQALYLAALQSRKVGASGITNCGSGWFCSKW